MNSVYLALGSNLGDREQYLREGIHSLAARDIHIVSCASVYSTEPLEILDQPWFLNTVVEVRTDLAPNALLRACIEVEKQSLRTRHITKGPRTLDIDIIFYGAETIQQPDLSIPHPSFSARRFVLGPLAEIAGDFRDPLSGKTVTQLLESCKDHSSVQLTPIRLWESGKAGRH